MFSKQDGRGHIFNRHSNKLGSQTFIWKMLTFWTEKSILSLNNLGENNSEAFDFRKNILKLLLKKFTDIWQQFFFKQLGSRAFIVLMELWFHCS